MPDTDATRAARYRRHRAGDHSMCRHAPLRAVSGSESELAAPLDPQAELLLLARRLAAAYAADPGNSNLARELRQTLLCIQLPDDPDDPLDAELSQPSLAP
jgi:hypothetical protein